MIAKQKKPTALNKGDKGARIRRGIQTSIWLIMALIVGALILLLWLAKASFASQTDIIASPNTQETVASVEFKAPAEIGPLHELDNEVTPVSFDPLVRDMRQHPKEFIDKQFLKNNAGKWTVQVMDVSEYEVITEYLNNRDDRSKFAYFRYRDENDKPRYILTYDVFPSAQMAMGAAKLIDFNLPANIRVIPEEIDRYLSVIENYELSGQIQDLNTKKTRKVNLQPTRRVVPVRAPKEEATTNKNSNPQEKPVTNTTSSQPKADKNSNAVNSATPSKSIKDFTDNDDVLTVKEARAPAVSENEPSANTSEEKPVQSATPKKSAVKKETATATNTTKPQKEAKPVKNTPDTEKKDPMKALIEEKSN